MTVNEQYYRVFQCPGKAYFERKLIMEPSYIAEEYQCIYDSKETAKDRVVLHSVDEQWMDYVRRGTML